MMTKNELIDNDYKYGWILEFNRMQLGSLADLNWNNDLLIEARFFNEKKELHVLKYCDKVLEAEKEFDDGESCFYHEYALIPRFGKSIRWRRFISEDEDGQKYISANCLCGWVGNDA